MIRVMLIAVLLAGTAACSNKTPDLKSPCAGAEGNPCDRRAPANQG